MFVRFANINKKLIKIHSDITLYILFSSSTPNVTKERRAINWTNAEMWALLEGIDDNADQVIIKQIQPADIK